jgi:peptide/nickel transport system ATP-binding protein
VIQPSEYDLDQAVWRSIMNFKQRARDADMLTSITAVEEDQAGRTDPSDLSVDELDELVRKEFELPKRVSDPGAERKLSDAIERLHDDDIVGARERLDDAFESPCEATKPEQVPTGETHEIACLLYDDRHDASQSHSSGDESDDALADD